MKSLCDPATLLILIHGLVLCAAVIQAAPPDPRERSEKRVFRDSHGQSLPYRLFVPKSYDAAKKYPLLLFLHGAGERGDDNWAQLANAEVLQLIKDDVAAKHPCFLVAPQCPAGAKWVEAPWNSKKPHHTPAEPSAPMRLALEMLDSLEKEYSIDPARRYVTGLSMGGYGSFDACLRRPGYFAAAVPICGGADDARYRDFVGTSFWIFHGGNDSVVPVGRSRSIYHQLKAAGANAKYTEYPGVDHNSWSKAYFEPGLADWLFAQYRIGARQ
jgi:predicted peptidase